MTARIKYPIGIQSFENIISGGFVYVDKTELIYNLVHDNRYVFLSRPRRFGKSLLLSTIKSYFEGRSDLFRGLAVNRLESEWKKYPVLSLALMRYNPDQEGSLETIVGSALDEWERTYGRRSDTADFSQRFYNVILSAYEKTGSQVVILVDEYDAPLVSHLHEEEKYERMLELLKSIYVNLKECDDYIRFAMLTGVSRFSKMTVFSGLNNLDDITLDDDYSEICGITEAELQTNFDEGIERLAAQLGTDRSGALARLKDNYDGYHFTKNSPDLYNPFSLLNALKKREIGNYWFATATPSFLIRRIRETDRFLPQFFDETVDLRSLSAEDSLRTTPTAMLFQTGYLTIKGFEEPDVYLLGIPNLEVRKGLFEDLAAAYLEKDNIETFNSVRRVRSMLEARDIDGAMELLRAFMAGIPYCFSAKAPELHYENNLFIIFILIGVDARPEWTTSQGRIDLVLRMRNYTYVIELKLDGTPEEALAQIESKEYALQFSHSDRPVVKLGINFSTATRNISGWAVSS